ncbi:MAG: non-canonical purine NTP pyrophosphatase [Gemmatimonadetes bacterium]|nr:non-canonical purine NTP pyrophosphatase [Gemmatimonadota bacterium]
MIEIRRILGAVPGLRLIDLDSAGITKDPAEEELEPYETFEENARSKAEYFHAKSGIPTVADDSGIAVDALGGAPGVRSKRFAPDRGLDGRELDQANNDHLMAQLGDLDLAARTGRYVCAAVLVGAAEVPVVVRGEAEGLILGEPRGRGGFGYDPYFFDPKIGKTFAELDVVQKNERSHRGRAFRALADELIARGIR